jgi:hypothetical protein
MLGRRHIQDIEEEVAQETTLRIRVVKEGEEALFGSAKVRY